ncbi:MAG: hypothetical protein WA861_09110, partial [Candidatus Binatus sp.]
ARPRVNRAPRADFIASPKCRKTCETVWRMAQSDANCSPRQIPRLTGKEQGIQAISCLIQASETPKSSGSIWFFRQIPYSTEQGIIFGQQGFIFADQGIYTTEQGNQ